MLATEQIGQKLRTTDGPVHPMQPPVQLGIRRKRTRGEMGPHMYRLCPLSDHINIHLLLKSQLIESMLPYFMNFLFLYLRSLGAQILPGCLHVICRNCAALEACGGKGPDAEENPFVEALAPEFECPCSGCSRQSTIFRQS
jgi:hypothetical protein